MKEILRLLPYLRPYRGRILLGLLMVVLANGFTLATPWLTKEAIDALGSSGVDSGIIVRYALLIVGTAILGGAARYAMRELLNGVSRYVEFDLRNAFFAHLMRLDARFFGGMPTGEIMSRATNDIAAVRMAAGPAYMYLVNTVTTTIFSLTLMIWIDPSLTLISMIPMIALPPITILFGKLIHERFEAIQERFGEMSTMVQENLAGMRIVKAYTQEDRQKEIFDVHAHEYLDRNLSLARVSGLFHPALGLFAGIAMAIALLIGGRAAMTGQITIGDFVAFTLYLGMLTWPMIALGWVINLFQRGSASLRRINRVLDSEPDIQSAEEGLAVVGPVKGVLEARNVSFRYPGTERFVLRDLNFRAEAGSSLALVGATGSGKSTLVHLLVRFYDPTEGEILLDGVPIRQIPLEELRGAIGVVPQEAFLFSDSIRNNLSIGFDLEADAAEQRFRSAAAVAQLDETVMEFPKGYDTMLGERGVNLSGGQKQRATLARAIARDPRVLILDDSLSAVDTHTEARILRELRDVLSNRTSVIVSHRVSAVMGSDQILVLSDGEIVERGDHEQLVAGNGEYAKLLRRQMLEESVGADAELAAPENEV